MTDSREDPSRSAPVPEADLAFVRTVPVAERPNKVLPEMFAAPPPAEAGARTFAAFAASLLIPKPVDAEVAEHEEVAA